MQVTNELLDKRLTDLKVELESYANGYSNAINYVKGIVNQPETKTDEQATPDKA